MAEFTRKKTLFLFFAVEFWWAKNARFTLTLYILRKPKLHVFSSLCFKFSSRCLSKAFFVNRKPYSWRKVAFCRKPRLPFPTTHSETRQDKIHERKLLAPTYFDNSTQFSQRNGLEFFHQSLILWCNTFKRLLEWETSKFCVFKLDSWWAEIEKNPFHKVVFSIFNIGTLNF